METKTFQCGKSIVTIVNGFAIDQDVDAALNSANNGLLLGSGGSKRIREKTGYLEDESSEVKEFCDLCSTLGTLGAACLKWLKDQQDKPTRVQLECLRILNQNKGNPLGVGTAVLTSSGNLVRPKQIIHAIAMGYTWASKDGHSRGDRIEATEKSLNDSLQSAIAIVREIGVSSLALPLMCARPGYGIGPETTYEISIGVIAESNLVEVLICADNEHGKAFFDRLS